MNFWHTLSGYFGSAGHVNPERGTQRSVMYATPNETKTDITEERAMKLSAVFACGRLISGIGAHLPIDIFEKGDQGERKELPKTHFLNQILRRRPNQYMNSQEFRRVMLACRVWWGNAYAQIGWNSQGNPVSLLPIHPSKVKVEREPWGTKFTIGSESNNRTLENRRGRPAQMMHVRGMSTDGLIGMSPLGYARHSLGISIAAERKVGAALSGVPYGFWKTDQIFSNEDREELMKIYQEVGNPFTGDGSIFLMEGGIDFKEVGMNPDDLQMLESRSFQVADIARFFGVPSVMIDAAAGASASWPASYEQQQMSFLTFTLREYLEEFEAKVREVLLPPESEIYAEHSVDGLLRTDASGRAQYYSTMAQNGIMTRNEIRKLEHLPLSDDPAADELTVQLNLATLQGIEDGGPEPGTE